MPQPRTTQDLKDELSRRNPRSEAVWKRAQGVFPGGDNGGMRYYPPFPFYASRAKGGHIWDLDGHEYVDICMAYGAHVLGHAPEPIMRALHEQIELGLHYAAPCEREVEYGQKLAGTSPAARGWCCATRAPRPRSRPLPWRGRPAERIA